MPEADPSLKRACKARTVDPRPASLRVGHHVREPARGRTQPPHAPTKLRDLEVSSSKDDSHKEGLKCVLAGRRILYIDWGKKLKGTAPPDLLLARFCEPQQKLALGSVIVSVGQ